MDDQWWVQFKKPGYWETGPIAFAKSGHIVILLKESVVKLEYGFFSSVI